MIQETITPNNRVQVTSDHWHVLRARWTGNRSGSPLYERTIVSEHDDRSSAASAAREVVVSFQAEMSGRTRETRDQVLVRRPGRKSLKIGKRAGRAGPPPAPDDATSDHDAN